ncbi:MAG TPA: response regulator transcription factor [Candidatus Sulfomarinibacteraceae bacterium]|nr:response regulator transcription factor [Candidatus Sulfomarinibacteraceae bacterium]
MKTATIKLFLAEDHHVMRAALRSLLTRESDLEVVGEAADGRELLAEVQRLQPDILLMDAEMPEHDPAQAVVWLREHCPQVKTLVLSAYCRRSYIVDLFKAGVHGYVLKDDAADTLLHAIHQVWQGEEWVSPKVAAVLVESLRQGDEKPLAQLTEREVEVLSLLALGNTNRAIAEELTLSEHTVRTHIYHIFNKLGVQTRVEAAVLAISEGLIPMDVIKNKFAGRL